MSSPTPTPGPATCPRCHRPIPAAAPLGACPHCLLAAGLPSAFGPATEGPPPPAPAELAPEFPALEIVELLGRGGMGAVYKARQRDLDRFVALKILRPGLDADPGFAERFTREARALAQLNHPGIVTLYEFGRTPAGRYFILMEFVDGMNLRGLLDAGRLAPREALAIVPPLCDALQYAHDRGLVHRDIKPENILVDRLGRVKIADFGIARLAADPAGASTPSPAGSKGLTEIGKAIGTPAYMAPEQRERPAEVDHRADLYALGVVLYQMLTGELPAPGQLQPPSHRVQIDVRLDEIVLRALEKDPALRYAAASEFKTHLETVTTTPHLAPAASPSASSPAAAPTPADYGFSYRSRRTLFGLPLLHVATGVDPVTGRRRIARGIIAIGEIAQGFIALGGVAMGGFTFGGISLGAFSYGGLVLALFAFGGLGIGVIAAFAGLAIAPVALGGYALGWYAFGGSTLGAYVSSPAHHDPDAIAFFGPWARQFTRIAGVATLAAMGVGFAIMFSSIEWARKRAATAVPGPATSASPAPAPDTRGQFSPWIVFLVLFAAYIDWLVLSGAQLPERVASHFNAHGQADGWMPRIGYLTFAALVPFSLAAFIALVGWSLRWLPAQLINLPRRDYWLAPERKAATAALLLSWMAGPACLLLVLFAEIHLAIVLANQLAVPRLAASFLMVPTLGFVIALMLWIVGLVLRFSDPDATAAKTRRQTSALLAAGLLTLGLCAIPLVSFAALKPDATAAAAQSAWNLDVVVTDHRAWPPQTLPADRALPVAGAALALLGSCETRSFTAPNWHAVERSPHLRLEYPRAEEGDMPDAILIPLPLTSNSSLWTRKREAVTRHIKFVPQKLAELIQALGPLAQPLARYQFSEAKEITLPHSKPLAYDFEQHRFAEYAPATESPHGIAASPHWHLKQGTDVFSDPGSPIPTVIFLGATVTELFSSAWDQSADLVASSLRLESKSPMTSVATPYPSQAPVTRLYRTLQNGLVLVQLLGSTDTKDTSLRYKFILPATDAPAGPTAHAPDGSELIRHNVESTVTDQRSWPPRVFPPDCALPVIEATRALLASATGPISATEDDWRAAQALPHLRLDRNPRTSGDLPDTVVIPLPLVTAKTVWARSDRPSDRNEIKRYYALSPSKAIALERSLAPFLELRSQFRFAPEKQITLTYDHTRAYDFDQERFIEYRPEFKPKEQPPKGVLPSTQWLFEQGGDAYASADSSAGVSLLGTYLRQGTHGLATSMTTVESEVWDKTADEVAFYSNATWEGHLATFYASPGYRLYSTKEGGLVLVHVLGEVDGGIKLRYKAIVPAEPANPAAPAPLPNP